MLKGRCRQGSGARLKDSKVDDLDLRLMHASYHNLQGDPCLTSCTKIQDFLVLPPAPIIPFLEGERVEIEI